MRAADECHPLPDQLHPCSWFSWFCSLVNDFGLATNLLKPSQPRRSMRFTTPSIASAEKPVFGSEKYSFPKPWFPSPLLFRHPPLRFDSIFSNGYRSCSFGAPKERESFNSRFSAERRVEIGLLMAPVKETRTLQSEIRFPRCEARASEPFSSHRFCRRSPEKTCAISLAAVFKRLLSKISTQISYEIWDPRFFV